MVARALLSVRGRFANPFMRARHGNQRQALRRYPHTDDYLAADRHLLKQHLRHLGTFLWRGVVPQGHLVTVPCNRSTCPRTFDSSTKGRSPLAPVEPGHIWLRTEGEIKALMIDDDVRAVHALDYPVLELEKALAPLAGPL